MPIELPKQKTSIKTNFGSMKTLIYGNSKIGKSTFCSHIPDALFVATEDGLSYLEVCAVRISTWAEFLQLCTILSNEDHGYKTLVIDIVDFLFEACEAHICKLNGVKDIADIPMGGGYGKTKKEFIRVFNSLNHKHNLGIVFVSHAKSRTVKKKNSSYTAVDCSLGPSYADAVSGFVDHIFYAYIDENGNRIMRTKTNKYINAGDRSGQLPELMEFKYASFKKEFDKIHVIKKVTSQKTNGENVKG